MAFPCPDVEDLMTHMLAVIRINALLIAKNMKDLLNLNVENEYRPNQAGKNAFYLANATIRSLLNAKLINAAFTIIETDDENYRINCLNNNIPIYLLFKESEKQQYLYSVTTSTTFAKKSSEHLCELSLLYPKYKMVKIYNRDGYVYKNTYAQSVETIEITTNDYEELQCLKQNNEDIDNELYDSDTELYDSDTESYDTDIVDGIYHDDAQYYYCKLGLLNVFSEFAFDLWYQFLINNNSNISYRKINSKEYSFICSKFVPKINGVGMIENLKQHIESSLLTYSSVQKTLFVIMDEFERLMLEKLFLITMILKGEHCSIVHVILQLTGLCI